jgi:hypothetical protein
LGGAGSVHEACRPTAFAYHPLRMRRRPTHAFAEIAGLSALLGTFGCVHNPDRLPHLDRQFYENLPDDKQQQAFLRLKESERQAFLEQQGLWARWTELSSDERDAVKNRSVEVGYKEFAAHMAWGPAADVREGESNGRIVRYETFIRCTSGPRAGAYVRQNIDCDGTSSEVQLAIENGIVTEIKYLD